MRTVHPEYFTDTRMWEANGLREPTLCALQARLGRGVKIKGYFPKGYNAPFSLADPLAPVRSTMRTTYSHVRAFSKKFRTFAEHQADLAAAKQVTAHRRTPEEVVEINKQIDAMLFRGIGFKQIGIALNMTKAAAIGFHHRNKKRQRCQP